MEVIFLADAEADLNYYIDTYNKTIIKKIVLSCLTALMPNKKGR